ncbi:uncharacterized protein UDID_17330 [Ustilago sp. UG-2017a]|nr:uncharacterized protein UDID_17330 [Ustilago sp. UG-2017a]
MAAATFCCLLCSRAVTSYFRPSFDSRQVFLKRRLEGWKMLQARLYDNASTVKTIIACSSLQSWTKMMMTTLVALSVACDADTDQIPLPALFNTIVIETVSVETTARPHGPSLLSNDNHNEQPLYGAANVSPIHQYRKRTPICGVRQVKIGRHPIPVGCHGTLDQR